MPQPANTNGTTHGHKDRLDAFTIVAREGAKPFWVKIGAAFENSDGSVNLYLDALPVNGKVQLRRPDRRNGEGERD